MASAVLVAVLATGVLAKAASGEGAQHLPFLTVGVFIASIEEGARIFTPVRLLPFEHPEAGGHEFPNALQLRGTEFEVLILLGEKAGLGLRATLERYPRQPDESWPYEEFSQPPLEALRYATVVRKEASTAPLPGLRVAAFHAGCPVGFIVDTRGLTLAERGMSRATTMGLDLTRAPFLDALRKSQPSPLSATTIVVYGARQSVPPPNKRMKLTKRGPREGVAW